MTRRVEVGAHLLEVTLREPSPLVRTGVPWDPRDPVSPRPELQFTEGTARWCGRCAERRLAHYENHALRCAACGYATQPLPATDMREVIQVVLQDLSIDELRTGYENALLKVWSQRAALANGTDHQASRSRPSPLYPTALLPLPGAEALPAKPPRPGVIERFWEKVDKTGSCWLWLGDCDWKGFGKVPPDRDSE